MNLETTDHNLHIFSNFPNGLHDWKSYEAAEQRMASVIIAALGAGGDAYDSKHWDSGFNNTVLKSLEALGIAAPEGWIEESRE